MKPKRRYLTCHFGGMAMRGRLVMEEGILQHDGAAVVFRASAAAKALKKSGGWRHGDTS